mmetsp:Transcript_17161/g.69506  ORF Transcript_17161/g.69506 Transcript_17161/m.69506 type:complete len:88 (+) Transcript_17161:490-753(+)
MVVIPAATGEMGIVPSHVPTVAQMIPGMVSVFTGEKVRFRSCRCFSEVCWSKLTSSRFRFLGRKVFRKQRLHVYSSGQDRCMRCRGG